MASFRNIGCGLLVAGCIAYPIWVSTPNSQHAPQIKTIVDTRQQAFDQAQKRFTYDLTSNTYLDPTLREVWARKTEYKENGGNMTRGPVSETVTEMNKYNPINFTNTTVKDMKNISLNLGKDLAKFEATRKAWLALLPKVQAALARPVFLAPAAHVDAQEIAPNYIGMRQVAQVLAFEAELEAEEKKPDDGALNALLIVHFGHNVGFQNGQLINSMIAVSLQTIGYDTLHGIVTRHELKAETLEKIFRAMNSDLLPEDLVAVSLENEILMVHNSAKVGAHLLFMQDGPAKPSIFTRLLDFSGLANREVRMYNNDMFELLEATRRGGPTPDLKWVQGENFVTDELTGKHGFVSMSLIPNVGRALPFTRFMRTRMGAMRVIAALKLYQMKNKKYPDSLELLKEVGLQSVPQNEVSKSPFVYKLENGKPSLQIPVDEENREAISSAGPSKSYQYKDGVVQIL